MERPQAEFVASFIGAGTLLEGKVVERGLAMVGDLQTLRCVGLAVALEDLTLIGEVMP